jgi:hypothetical protein
MPNVNRWALRLDLPPCNPGAGLAIGRPQRPRSEADMAAPLTGAAGPADWHPTVINLLVLIVLEMAAYAALRWAFRTAHGG